MSDRILCRATPCRTPAHYVGTFQTPFCSACYHALTPNKRAKVMTIASFNVLEPGSHLRATRIVDECRRYLLGKESWRHA